MINCLIGKNSTLEKHVNVTQKIYPFFSIFSVILSVSDRLHYLWGKNFFGNSTTHCSNCLYQFWSSKILSFILHTKFKVQRRLEVFSLVSVFQRLVIAAISTTVRERLSREVFVAVSTFHSVIPILILAWKWAFYYLECSNSYWHEKAQKIIQFLQILSIRQQ